MHSTLVVGFCSLCQYLTPILSLARISSAKDHIFLSWLSWLTIRWLLLILDRQRVQSRCGLCKGDSTTRYVLPALSVHLIPLFHHNPPLPLFNISPSMSVYPSSLSCLIAASASTIYLTCAQWLYLCFNHNTSHIFIVNLLVYALQVFKWFP